MQPVRSNCVDDRSRRIRLPKKGFGHLNAFPAQFVLQSIERTWAKDLAGNYSPSEYATTPTRFPTAYIDGRLQGPDGHAIPDADLTIYDAQQPDAHIENDSATTDSKGPFHFAVPPGNYIIGFNTFWLPSPDFPFPPTYYPSALSKQAAASIAVEDREHRTGVNIKVATQLVSRKFPIRVLCSDGKPVADANVWLSQKSKPWMVVGTSVSHTASDGRFELIGFEKIDYILHADKYSGLGNVSCAANVLITANRPAAAEIPLYLKITDFKTCTATDFDIPAESN